MKNVINLIFVVAFCSCMKEEKHEPIIIDPYTYAVQVDWVEDSISTDNHVSWTKIGQGSMFSFLLNNGAFHNGDDTYFGMYGAKNNLKANFTYVIEKDSVLAIKQQADSVFVMNAELQPRTDVKGKLVFAKDTVLYLTNVGVTPGITIRYKLERKK